MGKPRIKDGTGNAAPPKEPKAPTGAVGSATNAPKTSMATLSPSSTVSTAATDTIQGTPWTLEALIQAAQQVVQPQPPQAEASGDSSPEKTQPQVRTIKLRDIRVCAAKLSTTALVDPRATHSLRTAHTEQEWQEASDVAVQLAGNYKMMMKITEAGTLLMPHKQLHANLEGNCRSNYCANGTADSVLGSQWCGTPMNAIYNLQRENAYRCSWMVVARSYESWRRSR